MDAAQEANAYLNETAPWKTAKTDTVRTATTLHTALSAINGIKVALAPYLPATSEQVHEMLGLGGTIAADGWTRAPLESGGVLGDVRPLFRKVDVDDS